VSEGFEVGDRVRVEAGMWANITGEVEIKDVRRQPYSYAVMVDTLGERRWFARDELTKEVDDVLE
jgi:transcription antitermination factor NusG